MVGRSEPAATTVWSSIALANTLETSMLMYDSSERYAAMYDLTALRQALGRCGTPSAASRVTRWLNALGTVDVRFFTRYSRGEKQTLNTLMVTWWFSAQHKSASVA